VGKVILHRRFSLGLFTGDRVVKPTDSDGGDPAKGQELTTNLQYRVLTYLETALCVMSVLVIGLYSTSTGSTWIPALKDSAISVLYLVLALIGMLSVLGMTMTTNSKIDRNGAIRLPFFRALVLFTPPFALFCGLGGIILTLAGGGSSIAPGFFLLYGYATGYLATRGLLTTFGVRRWRAIQTRLDETGMATKKLEIILTRT